MSSGPWKCAISLTMRHTRNWCIWEEFSSFSMVSHQVAIGVPCHMLRCWAFLGIMMQVSSTSSSFFIVNFMSLHPTLRNKKWWNYKSMLKISRCPWSYTYFSVLSIVVTHFICSLVTYLLFTREEIPSYQFCWTFADSSSGSYKSHTDQVQQFHGIILTLYITFMK